MCVVGLHLRVVVVVVVVPFRFAHCSSPLEATGGKPSLVVPPRGLLTCWKVQNAVQERIWTLLVACPIGLEMSWNHLPY